ncbi:MAG: hypothetical protein K0Q89_1630 [Thermomicrobiales bacterium]|nr:hypothetical protein [Thermomicrobiales bacterium]
MQRDTVLRADIEGFVPNPLYLSPYPSHEMSRTPKERVMISVGLGRSDE